MLLLFFSCSKSDADVYNEAMLAASTNDIQLQFDRYKEIVEQFKDSEHHAKALFQLGFLANNHFKDYESAKKYYTEFIKTYPKHELTDDAEIELKYMGMPVEELPMFKKIVSKDEKELNEALKK